MTRVRAPPAAAAPGLRRWLFAPSCCHGPPLAAATRSSPPLHCCCRGRAVLRATGPAGRRLRPHPPPGGTAQGACAARRARPAAAGAGAGSACERLRWLQPLPSGWRRRQRWRQLRLCEHRLAGGLSGCLPRPQAAAYILTYPFLPLSLSLTMHTPPLGSSHGRPPRWRPATSPFLPMHAPACPSTGYPPLPLCISSLLSKPPPPALLRGGRRPSAAPREQRCPIHAFLPSSNQIRSGSFSPRLLFAFTRLPPAADAARKRQELARLMRCGSPRGPRAFPSARPKPSQMGPLPNSAHQTAVTLGLGPCLPKCFH